MSREKKCTKPAAGDAVFAGITHATQRMKGMRAGGMGYTTSEVGDLVVEGASS